MSAISDPVSELFAEVAQWATAVGAGDLRFHPGLWTGETDEWKVEINGHDEDIDGLPFAHARLTNKTFLSLGIVSPFGGALASANEGDLIEHFRAARATLDKLEANSDD